MQTALSLLCLIALTLCSGVCDAKGFVYASQMWRDGVLVKSIAAKSSLWFSVGLTFYLFSTRYLQQIGVTSAELQTLFWFTVTLIGVAIINGRFAQWSNVDRIVAVIVLCGIGWLMTRNGG